MPNIGKDVKQLEFSLDTIILENNLAVHTKTGYALTLLTNNTTLRYREMSTNTDWKKSIRIFISFIYKTPNLWTTQLFISKRVNE